MVVQAQAEAGGGVEVEDGVGGGQHVEGFAQRLYPRIGFRPGLQGCQCFHEHRKYDATMGFAGFLLAADVCRGPCEVAADNAGEFTGGAFGCQKYCPSP